MKENQTKVALNWVKDEVESTLEQAQLAIKAYAEDESDLTQIHFCANCMHQIGGTMQMLEFKGASLLAGEMEALAEDIGENKVESLGQAFEVFLSAALQFKSYMARYADDKADIPVILMPIINAMRTCRKQELISAGSLINIDLSAVEAPRHEQATSLQGDIQLEVRNLRSKYQQGLLGYIRNIDSQANVQVMYEVVDTLWRLGARVPYPNLWWAASVFLKQVVSGEFNEQLTVKNISGKLDRRIRDLVEQKDEQEQADALLSNILFYVAHFNSDDKDVAYLQTSYKLKDVIASLGDYEQESENLSQVDTDSVKMVLAVIQEDLSEIKESLDLYIRTNSFDNDPLQEMLASLQKISDTMAMLNLNRPRTIIQEQIQAVNSLINDEHADRQQGLIRTAESILKLDDYVQRALELNNQQLAEHDSANENIDSIQVVNARLQLVQESRTNLYKVKDKISDYLEDNFDVKYLVSVPELLDEVEGALQFSKLENLSSVIAKTNNFMKLHLIEKKVVLSEEEVISLADAISSVDYYLEGLLSSGLHGLPVVLQKAVTSIDQLTSHYEDLSEDIPMLEESLLVPIVEFEESEQEVDVEEYDNDDLIDDEVREIFIEEAEEVLAEIHQQLPIWRDEQNNEQALSTLRRSFHTLKGSGRMVGASDVGELSWAVENMLNRLIDDSIQYSPAILVTTEQVTEQLPAMVASYARGEDGDYPQELADRANRISKGEIITDLIVEEEPATAVVEEDPEIAAKAELLEIFKQEAASHITNLEMFANQRVQGITQSQVSDNLLRSLHTLKGNAQITDNQSLRNVIIPVESYFRELKSRELMANESDMGLVAHTKDLLRHIVEMPEDLDVIATHEEAIMQELSSLQGRFDESIQTAEDDGRDPQLLKDVFNVAADVLTDMQANKLSTVESDARRDMVSQLMASNDRLHSLIINADIAPVEAITFAIGDALQRNLLANVVDSSIDELLTETHSMLENQFDCLAANLSIPEYPELVNKIMQWSPQVVETNIEESVEEVTDELPINEETIELQEPVAEFDQFDDEIDSELLEIFTEEADELLNSDARLLELWRKNPSDLSQIDELQRNLHTLKGSARMASFSEIGDLAHVIEDLYTALSEGLFKANEQTLQLAFKAEDRLVEMVGARVDSKNLGQADDLINEINQYIDTAKNAPQESDDEQIDNLVEEEAGVYQPITEDPASEQVDELDKLLAGLSDTSLLTEEQESELTEMTQDESPLEEASEEESLDDVVDDVAEVDLSEPEIEQPLEPDFIEFEQEALAELEESLEDQVELPEEAAVEPVAAEDELVPVIANEQQPIDSDIARLFLGEADELLADIDNSIEAWSGNLSRIEHVKKALRSLHSLKGGARLATISSIGNLTHRLESVMGLLVTDERLGQTRWLDMIRESLDKVNSMVVEVRNGRMPAEADRFLARLDNDQKIIEAQIQQLKQRETGKSDKQAEVKIISLTERQKQKDKDQDVSSSRDMIRVRSEVLDNLVNLAGEASILRARIEQQLGDLNFNLKEVSATVDRLRAQLRNLEIETEAQVLYRREISGVDFDEFDPLEMDRYTRQQELTRSLLEAASDLVSLQETLQTKVGDAEASLLQQSRINTELQDRLMRTRMVPFESIEGRLRRMVRQISSELGKEVKFNIESEGEMDRTVIERMVAPLEHMIRNAIDHGIESAEERKKYQKDLVGKINLSLNRRGNEVFIQIADDGAGIRKEKVKARAVAHGMIEESYQPTDRELYRLILQSGFSTAEEVTQISGRGVGMDVVHSEILQLGGSLNIQSEQGSGTTLTVRLPFTLSSNQSLMVKVKGENYAIPLSNITTVARVSSDELKTIYEQTEQTFKHLDQDYEIRYLGQILDRNSQLIAPTEDNIPVLIIQGEEKPIAVHVDEILGSREIVVKSVGRQLSTVPGISGASILGDGSVVLILDMQTLVDRFHEWDFAADTSSLVEEVAVEEHIPTVMVVDDSITVRKVTSRLLQRNQFKVMTAKDGMDAVTQLNEQVPDLMLLDIEMPRMDGFELATLIRRESRLKHLPIIMITSRTGEKHRQRAEEIGVNDYLGKPYNEDKLLKTIQNILDSQDE